MNRKRFNNLLLFVLFGIAVGFFGILYEGIVYGPKFLDDSMERMLFWKSFTNTISPVFYYAPTVYLASIALVILYFNSAKENMNIKRALGWATIFQIASLAITIYILTQINFKRSFGNLDLYANQIHGKAVLFNVLSIIRIVFAGIGLSFIFNSYIQTQIARH